MFVKLIMKNGRFSIKMLEHKIIIPRLDSSLFTWLLWEAGSSHDLDIICRYSEIISKRGKSILKKHCIGWCYGESLMCRPKIGEIAIMCFKDDVEFWFHIRLNEFLEIFCEDFKDG